jgi:hyaluronan synthase
MKEFSSKLLSVTYEQIMAVSVSVTARAFIILRGHILAIVSVLMHGKKHLAFTLALTAVKAPLRILDVVARLTQPFVPNGWSFIVEKSRDILIVLGFFTFLTSLILYKVVFIANMSFGTSFWTIYGLIATTFLVSRIPYAYLHMDYHGHHNNSEYPTVSIVIPAKNEEESIFETIKTCAESIYPSRIECIVIDDGSTDNTAREVLRAEFKYGSDVVRLIKFNVNFGKREAMAVGINESKSDIVIFVDSDSFLAPDAVSHITEHFLVDKDVGAVSGNTMVANANTNLLTRMQSIQYSISFNIYKASESVHSAVTCCPGCFSAYRREAVKPLVDTWKNHKFFGSQSTFGDDRGLTNYVLRDWKIVYCEAARASTKVPEKFRIYLKQQLRWKKSWIREGLFAATFMWRKTHPLASVAFYVNFTFPILGPILAGFVLWRSVVTENPLLFVMFMGGFVLLGTVFALFSRVSHKAENWMFMPVFSVLFVTMLIWQMPYALLTLKNTSWGTR